MAILHVFAQYHLKNLAKSSGEASEEVFQLAVESGRCINELREEIKALTKSKQSHKSKKEGILPAEDAIEAERYYSMLYKSSLL